MKNLTLLLFAMVMTLSGLAQTINGAQSVGNGSSMTYYFDNGGLITSSHWVVTSTKGTITSNTVVGTKYTIIVNWTATGSATVTFSGTNLTAVNLSITIATCGSGILPTITNGSRCQPGTVLLQSVPDDGNTARWYSVASGGSIIATTNNYTTPSLSTSTTYYVSGLKTSNGCETARVTVTATVTNPTVSGSTQTVCSGGAIALKLINTVATLNTWTVSSTNASGASGGSATSTTDGASFSNTITQTLTATSSAPGIVGYSVTPSLGSCNGVPVLITAIVNPIPTASLSTTSQTICSESTATISMTNSNSVSGTTFTWSSNVTNATIPYDVQSGASITGKFWSVDQATDGTAEYTIRALANGCYGTPQTSTVTIHPTPPMPITRPVVFYGFNASIMSIAVPSGQQATWYEQACSGCTSSSVGTGSTYSYSDDWEGTFRPGFFVTMKDVASGCESVKAVVSTTYVKGAPPSMLSVTQEVIRVAGKKTDADVNALSPLTQKSMTVSYFDGLSRPVQKIALNASPTGNHIIQPIAYDSYGRTPVTYLPYTSTDTARAYKNSTYADQLTFYSTASKIAHDGLPYAAARYEASPLSRIVEQGNIGSGFQPGGSTPKTKKVTYGFNTGATSDPLEEVRIFAPDGSSPGFYAAKNLSRTSSADENNNVTVAFTDGSGKVIAKKEQLGSTINGTMVNYLETYYVYDDFDHLKFIIPPGGIAAIRAVAWTTTLSAPSFTIIAQHFHQFIYDFHGRLFQKKTPGQDWTYYIYDKMNRLVLTQDANIRSAHQWVFVKYDQAGRKIMSGIYTNTSVTTPGSMQVLAGNAYNSLTVTGETRGTSLNGYTNTTFPTANSDSSPLSVLTVNYFDDYDYDNNGTDDYTYDNTHVTGLPTASTTYLRGRATGSMELILTTTSFLKSTVFYDDFGRAIQTQHNNHMNLTALEKSSVVYDFEKATSTKTDHDGGTGNQLYVIQQPLYSNQGRVTGIKHGINGAALTQLVNYQHNELGQVVMKQLHDNGGGSYLQNVDYRYDIRGRLTSINNASLTNDSGTTNGDTNDYFGMEFLYETTDSGVGNTALYNGNITGIKWKLTDGANNTQNQKSYAFGYDKTDKLLSAAFKKTATGNAETGTYDEAMTYDHNGNILGLTRKQNSRSISGTTITNTAQLIDNLSYTYTSNQLQKVDDASTNTAGFNDGSTTTTEYTYDTHGNMTADANKGVSNITYNVLGKANLVTMTNGTTIQYYYSAGGTKLATVTLVGSTYTYVQYVNGFVYNNTGINYFSSPEGRVVKNGSSFEYQYAIQDHQGNTRVLFSSSAPAVETITEGFESTPSPNFDYVCTNLVPYGRLGGSASFIPGGDHSIDIAVAKSKHIYPGDKVELNGWVYHDGYAWGVGSSLADYATFFYTYFTGLSAPGYGETHTSNAAIASYGSSISSGYANDTPDTSDPKVFLTILAFDKNFNLIHTEYQQLQTVDAWENMDVSYTATEESYIYAYISNEDPMKLSIFVDDVTFTYTPTRIIQSSEYYPYGLQTASSWTRDNSVGNNYLYNQGSELNATTAMYDLPYRNYDAALGRFFQVDLLAYYDPDLTPYHYAGSDPVNYIDPSGLLKATANDLITFINLAFANNGGSWSDDGGIDFFSESEANVISGAIGDINGTSGSSIDKFGNGQAGGLNWFKAGSQFMITMGIGRIHDDGGITETSTTSFVIDLISDLISLGSGEINYWTSANSADVSGFSQQVLQDLMAESGNTSLSITSTFRTPTQQASVMHKNIASLGAASQKALYGPAGKQVIDMYPDEAAMLAKINELGPANVSKHCADPAVRNVMDIDPGSLSDSQNFISAIQNNTNIDQSRFFQPSNDPAFHIEIKQP